MNSSTFLLWGRTMSKLYFWTPDVTFLISNQIKFFYWSKNYYIVVFVLPFLSCESFSFCCYCYFFSFRSFAYTWRIGEEREKKRHICAWLKRKPPFYFFFSTYLLLLFSTAVVVVFLIHLYSQININSPG